MKVGIENGNSLILWGRRRQRCRDNNNGDDDYEYTAAISTRLMWVSHFRKYCIQRLMASREKHMPEKVRSMEDGKGTACAYQAIFVRMLGLISFLSSSWVLLMRTANPCCTKIVAKRQNEKQIDDFNWRLKLRQVNELYIEPVFYTCHFGFPISLSLFFSVYVSVFRFL